MNLDTFNYGNGGVLATQDNYKQNQYNAQGLPLSPTTPANGAPIAVDNTNDDRNAIDFKKQAIQAQQDTMGAVDTSNKIVGKSGYMYDKVDTSRKNQIAQAAMSYFDTYISHMGNEAVAVGEAARAASGTVNQLNAMAKRESLIPSLEAKGYNSLDIDKWRQTGDPKDLIVNMGKWTSDGHGFEHNTLTGESRPIPGYQEPQKALHYLKNPDGTYTAVNPITNETAGTVGQPKANTSATGGGIGLDDEDNNGYVFENGQWVQHTTYANGTPKTVVAGPKMQSQLNAQQAAKNPSASETLVNSDLDALDQAVNSGKANNFTGQVVGRNGFLGDVASSLSDQDTRNAYNAATRVQGYMQNQGVGAAKAMGLSGINTLEEAKRAFASMPQLDMTSPEALSASTAKIRSYVQQYNDQARQNQGVGSDGTESAPAKSGSKYSNLW